MFLKSNYKKDNDIQTSNGGGEWIVSKPIYSIGWLIYHVPPVLMCDVIEHEDGCFKKMKIFCQVAETHAVFHDDPRRQILWY